MLTRVLAAASALNVSTLRAAESTGTLDRDIPPPIRPPVPLRAPKLTGTTQCGCGRVISGNKLLCKSCGDAIVLAINGLLHDQRTQEQAQMQWGDDGGPA